MNAFRSLRRALRSLKPGQRRLVSGLALMLAALLLASLSQPVTVRAGGDGLNSIAPAAALQFALPGDVREPVPLAKPAVTPEPGLTLSDTLTLGKPAIVSPKITIVPCIPILVPCLPAKGAPLRRAQ